MSARQMVLWLTLLVLLSAFGVIFAKHENRRLFVQLQVLEKARDQLAVEWGQLQLEQGAWASHSQVESVARKRLQMVMPDNQSVVIIQQ